MTFLLNPDDGIFIVNNQKIPIAEMTNQELRDGIQHLNDFSIDTMGNNDDFLELLQNELTDRGFSYEE